MIDFGAILRCLGDGGVEFIVIGGLAGVVHGAARLTFDVDVVYRRTPQNFAKGRRDFRSGGMPRPFAEA